MPRGVYHPVCVDGVEYPSIAAAARALGITKQALITRKGMPGYETQRRIKATWDAGRDDDGVIRSTARYRKWKKKLQ